MAAKASSAASTGKRPPRQSVAELAPTILELLPAKAAEVARSLGRKPSDGTVRRALQGLEQSGAAQRVDGIWQRCQELPRIAPPAGCDDESKRLHAETLEALQKQGTWRDHDIELLNDYVERSQDVREFKQARRRDNDFQRSKTGRVFAHPAIDKERDARRDVQALRDALVLTPDARKKHGRDGDDDPDGDGDEFDF
jgi:P27 family predicted phage terminase small subunit